MRSWGVIGAWTLLLALPASALVIRGDPFWVADSTCSDGWQLPETDDSQWPAIEFPWLHVWPRDWPADPKARPFWGTKLGGPTCVRRSFDLEELPEEPARLSIFVDDDYDLYLNGELIGQSHDRGANEPGEIYEVGPHLRLGRNVIALRLIDVGGTMAAWFSLSLPGVPEPRTWAQSLRLVRPWLEFALIVAALIAVGLGIRRCGQLLGPRLARAGPWALALAMVGIAAACQWMLATHLLYSGEREIPLPEWHWTWIVPAAASFALLVILAAAQREAAGARPPRAGRWLLAILLVGLTLRVAWLDAIPVGLFGDEAVNGVDALALGIHKDWQVWSGSLGGRPTLFLYLLYACSLVFGAGYLALKIVPVTLAMLTIPAVYLLARLGLGVRVALWSAFLLAVSRWHIHYSRMAWEAICVPLFAAGGFALLLFGVARHHGRRRDWIGALAIIAGIALLSAGLYTYASYRAFAGVGLVFLLSLLVRAHRARLRRRWLAVALGGLAGGAIVAPLLRFAYTHPHEYWYRYSEVSLTSYISYFGTPIPWLHQIGRSLLSFNGTGDELIRHNLPYAPHLDPLTGALFLIGVALLIWRWRELGPRLVLVWLAVFLAIASLTRDGPHATRLLGALVPACICAAVAITYLLEVFTSRRWRQSAAIMLAAAVLTINAYRYFVTEGYHIDADWHFNMIGRGVCEYVATQQQVDLYWSDDIAFFSDPQCQYLARGRYEAHRLLGADVVAGDRFRHIERNTLVVFGQELLARERIELDARRRPKVELGVPPIIGSTRWGWPIYYLYHLPSAPEPPQK